MRQLKRKWRSFVHICLLGVLVAAWVLAMFPYTPMAAEYTYDPNVGSSILTEGCDVEFVASNTAKVAVAYKRHAGGQRTTVADDGVDFFFDNAGGEALDAVLNRLRPKVPCSIDVQIPHRSNADVCASQLV